MYKYIYPFGVSVGYSTNVYCELSLRNYINIFPIVFEFVNSLMREVRLRRSILTFLMT